jgi:hypothetical protein
MDDRLGYTSDLDDPIDLVTPTKKRKLNEIESIALPIHVAITDPKLDIKEMTENILVGLGLIANVSDRIDFWRQVRESINESISEGLLMPYNEACKKRKRIRNQAFGDERVREIINTLDLLATREPPQIKFHREFLKASLPLLYGETYDANLPRLLKEYDTEEIHQETFVSAPRRGGKTWAVAMFAAAILWVVPDSTVSVFARGMDISRKMGKLIRAFLEKLIKHAKEEEHDTSTSFKTDNINQVAIMRKGTRREVECKTDSEHARGSGGDLLIADEGAQMKRSFVDGVLTPMLALEKTCFICISSPLGASNWMTRRMEMKDDDGRPMFNVIKLRDICDECMKKPYAERVKCEHTDMLPSYKSGEKIKKFGQMFSKDKGAGTFLREMKGMEGVEGYEPKFRPEDIHNLCDDPIKFHYQTTSVKHTFVSIDPGGGGQSDTSKFGVSVFYVLEDTSPTGEIVPRFVVCIYLYFLYFVLYLAATRERSSVSDITSESALEPSA